MVKIIYVCYIISDEDLENDGIKTVMKSHIFGIITGIQKFSRKTVYSGLYLLIFFKILFLFTF